MGALPQILIHADAVDFIDDGALEALFAHAEPDPAQVREIVSRSVALEPLTVAETAVLLAVRNPEMLDEIFAAARGLKRAVYGNRIVLFAPLYIGNDCVNECAYCAFHAGNRDVARRTLSDEQIRREVQALENAGHRRTILVFGEHPRYDAHYMAHCLELVYSVRAGRGEIRRASVNAAPLDVAGFRTVAAAGIATFQIFQETYHHATYARVHGTRSRKSDYLWRLSAMDRAMEAGIGDVGIGALFGLYDWRFEVLGLVAHARHLMERHGAGPHTLSFPRLQPASGVQMDRLGEEWLVSDADYRRMVAILRLAVPYAGMVCTARESADVRRSALALGVTQMDAGTRIDLGGYTEASDSQVFEREQFRIGDVRPLDEVVRELLDGDFIPSFCTACYRLGRTGERFMEQARPGEVHRLCTPNALATLQEYLIDYASPATRALGEGRLREEVARIEGPRERRAVVARLRRIAEGGERDLYA